MIVMFVLFFSEVDRITINRKLDEELITAREIENVTSIGNKLIISGWILRDKSVNMDVKIILKSLNGSKSYLVDTVLESDNIINKYFSENWDYGNIRFKAEIKKDKIKKDISYEIIIVFRYNTETVEKRVNVETGKYIYNGKLYSYDPDKFVIPKFQDEWMKEVVENGEICFYDAEETVYIYKYKEKFYWIVGENFRFNKEGKTYITYQMWTTMPEKLPEHRKAHGYENWDFYFEDNEYVLTELSMYRVAVKNVPTNFPVTHYYTAIYDLTDNTFIWKKAFYPFYNLNE